MTKEREIQTASAELSDPHIFEIIRGVLLSSGLQQEAFLVGLDPKLFRTGSLRKYGLILRAAMDVKALGATVSHTTVFGQVIQLLANQPSLLEPAEQVLVTANNPEGLLWKLFYTQHPLDSEYWRVLLKKFMEEYQIFAGMRTLVQMTASGYCPAGLTDFAKTMYENSQRLLTVSASPKVSILQLAAEQPLRTVRPTGVTFLDSFMGGHADSEGYSIYGPYGSGKSLLGQTIAVESACYDRTMHTMYGAVLRHWYLLSYELSRERATLRLLSCLGKISSKSLARYTETRDFSTLSTNKDPRTFKDYEKELFAADYATGTMLGEQERYAWAYDATEGPNANLHLLDMSGKNTDLAMVGQGYVPEITALLTRDQEELGYNIGGVVVDFADLVADRYMAAKGIDRDRGLRHHVGAPFAEQVIRNVACRFACPVWILYQFDTKTNSKPTWHLGNHGDGAGGKDSARGIDYCFVMSKTGPDGFSRFGVSKSRYGLEDSGSLVEVLKNCGDIGRMEGAPGYVFDNTQRKVVSRRDLRGTQQAMRNGNTGHSATPASINRLVNVPPANN